MLTTLIIIFKMGGCFLMGDESPAGGLHAPWSGMASFFFPTSLESARVWLSSWFAWQALWGQRVTSKTP